MIVNYLNFNSKLCVTAVTKYHIAKTTQEVIANRYAANVLTKKSNANTKPFKEKYAVFNDLKSWYLSVIVY